MELFTDTLYRKPFTYFINSLTYLCSLKILLFPDDDAVFILFVL